MSQSISPLRDRELLEILAEEPELLAIADALVETRQAQPAPKRRRLRPVLVRGWEPRLALVAASMRTSKDRDFSLPDGSRAFSLRSSMSLD